MNALLLLVSLLGWAAAQDSDQLVRRVTKRVSCSDAEKAQSGDTVSVSYTGRLASTGVVFDSSDGGDPISFELGKGVVIKGWDEGLVGTCPGEGLELDIPPALAYGTRGAGNGRIPPNSRLIFTLTLVSVKKSLQIEVLKESTNCPSNKIVRTKDKILIKYTMSLLDGTVLDSTASRGGEPLSMTVGETGVRGWDEGVKGACPGEIRLVTIPPHLAYGEKGVDGFVPPNSALQIEMEIVKVQDRVLSFLDQISSGTFGRGRRRRAAE